MDLSWGVSWKGILIFALVMLPNIFYFLYPPVNMPANNNNAGTLLNILENGSRVALFLLLIFLTNERKSAFTSPYMILMALFLGLYYILWIRYFMGGREYELLGSSFLFVPVPMAIFPVAFFLLSAVWLNNLPAAAAALIFGVAHITVTAITMR